MLRDGEEGVNQAEVTPARNQGTAGKVECPGSRADQDPAADQVTGNPFSLAISVKAEARCSHCRRVSP